MKKVVIAIDSFKGCLSSWEAGKAAEEGIKRIYPMCEVSQFPVADGGEGMLDVLMEATGGTYRMIIAADPLMRPIQTNYGISKDGCTAYIEMASINGLPLLSPEERNPMLTTTYGTGELISDALDQGCRQFIIGIGGSATNDAGIGMLQALGYRFKDANDYISDRGGQMLRQVVSVDTTCVHPALKDAHFTVACDVRNPFCGKEGAAFTFARQKGANDEMIEFLDQGMQSFAEVIHYTTGKNVLNYPGAGAAGGLGGAFLAFLNAELQSGIQLLLRTLDFSDRIKGADLIITGEGKVDRQTIMGKVPFGILEEATRQNIPVVVIAGRVEDLELLNRVGFRDVVSITPDFVTLEKAMEPEYAKENIKNTVSHLILNCR